MNRRMCFHIVVCALLSSSVAIFSMEQGTTAPKNSENVSPQSESMLGQKIKGEVKEVVGFVREAEDAFYHATNPVLEELGKNEDLMSDLAGIGEVSKKDADPITHKIAKTAVLLDKLQDGAHELFQKITEEKDADALAKDLAKVQVSPKLADNTTK